LFPIFFIKYHPSIIFTKADKGNITVALDKNKYITKMEEMLQDQDTYSNIKNNSINKLMNSARTLLTSWTKSNYNRHLRKTILQWWDSSEGLRIAKNTQTG